MNKPDWSKAPEWATHAVTTGPKWSGGAHLAGAVEWARFDGEHYFAGESDEVGHVFGESAWIVLEARPSQWRGPEDGLPPVGTVCEVNYLNKGWVECEIIAHFEQLKDTVAAFTVKRKNGIKEVEAYLGFAFRPIKTQEQRELEQMCADIDDAFNNDDGLKTTTRMIAEHLNAKGYRKP